LTAWRRSAEGKVGEGNEPEEKSGGLILPKAQTEGKESENYMGKNRRLDKDELRAEYKRSDFPEGLVRGKYAKRIRESSNVVVIKPEVAQAFPNEDAVNTALLSLIELAQKTTRLTRRSTGSPPKRASR
jgi:hypothetical protein